MTTTATEKRTAAIAAKQWAEKGRKLATLLNLHIAGVVVLGLVNLYLLAHMAVAWRAANSENAQALADQMVVMKTAEIARQPLEGLDEKLAQATKDADKFYKQRLPFADSEVAAELGSLAKKQGVKLTRVQYAYSPVLEGTAGELTEARMDAGLSGDYRPLVQFVNALERDNMFFLITGVTLTGQQSGTVGLRLRLTTYLRSPVGIENTEKSVAGTDGDASANGSGRHCGCGGPTMMRLTPDQQRKGGLIAAFVLIAAGILYYDFRDDSSPPPVAPAVVTAPVKAAHSTNPVVAVPPGNVPGAAAKSLGTTSAQLDPTLRMEAMLVTESLVYSGSGRNIFSASSVPIDIPKPIAPVRTKALPPPPPPQPVGPPPPPPIDLKFFGTATSPNGTRRAFLLHGDDVFLASDGDIVQRRYKVVSILANSIVVEDMTNNNRQTLPLLAR